MKWAMTLIIERFSKKRKFIIKGILNKKIIAIQIASILYKTNKNNDR